MKAKKLIKLIEMSMDEIETDFGFSSNHKIAGFCMGLLRIEKYGGNGEVQIELPLDNIDPDFHTVAVPLFFTFEAADTIYVKVKLDVGKYYAADDGKLKDLKPEDKTKVMEVIRANKSKLEHDLEEVIEDIYSEYYDSY